MKIINFRGDLTDNSAKKQALTLGHHKHDLWNCASYQMSGHWVANYELNLIECVMQDQRRPILRSRAKTSVQACLDTLDMSIAEKVAALQGIRVVKAPATLADVEEKVFVSIKSVCHEQSGLSGPDLSTHTPPIPETAAC